MFLFSCSLVLTASALQSITLVVLASAEIPTDASCTIIFGTDCELYNKIYLLAWKNPSSNLSMKYNPERMGTAAFSTSPNIAPTEVSSMCKFSIVVSITSTFLRVTLCTRSFSLTHIEIGHSGFDHILILEFGSCARLKYTIYKTHTMHAQLNCYDCFIIALRVQGLYIGNFKSADFFVRFPRRFWLVICFLNTKRNVIFAFVLFWWNSVFVIILGLLLLSVILS